MTISNIKAAGLAIAASGMAFVAAPAEALDFSEGTPEPISARIAPSAVPAADDSHHGRDRGWHEGHHRDRYYGRGYRNRAYYGEPVYRHTRVWRGHDGRYYCRRQDGTTGLLIGAAVGGLIGNQMAGRRGDQTLGTLLGAVGGALLGREIDRSDARCR